MISAGSVEHGGSCQYPGTGVGLRRRRVQGCAGHPPKHGWAVLGWLGHVTLALLSREAVGGENRQMRYDWRINRLNRPYKRPPKPGQGALDEALYQDEIQHFRNVLTIPILLDERTLAALMVKKRGRGAAFDAIEIEVAEHVATAAALALNSVRTRVSSTGCLRDGQRSRRQKRLNRHPEGSC